MSFYGPNAVLEDETTEVFEYNSETKHLEPVSRSSNSKAIPTSDDSVRHTTDMLKNLKTAGDLSNEALKATPDMFKNMPMKPSIWGSSMMPPLSSGSNPGMPPFSAMMPPTMPSMSQGQAPPNVPMVPPFPPVMGMWGMPQFGYQNPWGYQPMPGQPMPGQMPGQQRSQSASDAQQQQQQMIQQQMMQQQMAQQMAQQQMAQQQAFFGAQPNAQPAQPGVQQPGLQQEVKEVAKEPVSEPVKEASKEPLEEPPKEQVKETRKESQPKPPHSAERQSTPNAESRQQSGSSRGFDRESRPRSRASKNGSAGSSHSSAPSSAGRSEGSRPHTPRDGSQNRRNGQNVYSEGYMQESEAIRPNRRFRHLMTDHDKRSVMDKCVKLIAMEDPLVDDFYYHIFTRLHGTPGNLRGPLNQYRRVFNKGEGSTAERMRQQVQRAVERAQEFRQRAQESGITPHRTVGTSSRPRRALPALSSALSSHGVAVEESSRDATLRNIEKVYDNLLSLEAHAQRRPDPASPAAAEWASEGPKLQEKLWQSFLVQRQADKSGRQPFIEMVKLRKGMKAFARSWLHFDPTRRLTVLTRFVVNIESVTISDKDFELFCNDCLQPILHLISEADFETVLLMTDLVQSKAVALAASRVGQLLITAILSRGETLATSTDDEEERSGWAQAFAPIFDEILPSLNKLDVKDDQVWHFLASLALGSDVERQSELVERVRDQIFAQQAVAKKLGGEEGEHKIQVLNLFLNVLGLNATPEEINELKA